MREMMEAVMTEGTGKLSQLSGYTSGGKSGTAQMIDRATGRYSATRYNASFVGFAPVNNPAVTILAVLDSPVGKHMGAEVSAQIFKRVAEQVLAYLDVPHDVTSPSDVLTAKNQKPAQAAQAAAPGSQGEENEAGFEAAVAKSQAVRGAGADRGGIPRRQLSATPAR